jgi:hypothetical protein
MAKFVAEQKLEDIAMPRMCSGLDGLNWLWVRDVLQDAWKDTDLTVHVYNLKPVRLPLHETLNVPHFSWFYAE